MDRRYRRFLHGQLLPGSAPVGTARHRQNCNQEQETHSRPIDQQPHRNLASDYTLSPITHVLCIQASSKPNNLIGHFQPHLLHPHTLHRRRETVLDIPFYNTPQSTNYAPSLLFLPLPLQHLIAYPSPSYNFLSRTSIPLWERKTRLLSPRSIRAHRFEDSNMEVIAEASAGSPCPYAWQQLWRNPFPCFSSALYKKDTPQKRGVSYHITFEMCDAAYIASEPPSPSGQGPLPRAVEETSSLPTTGTVHFTILLLCIGKPIATLFFLNG